MARPKKMTADELMAIRMSYVPKIARETAVIYRPKDVSAVIIAYSSARTGKPCAVMFIGNSTKAYKHHSFASDMQREKTMKHYIDATREQQAANEKYKAKRKVSRALEVGDILEMSWGYDQTNVNFYQVTGLIGAASVTIREIAQKVDHYSGDMAEYVVPVPNEFLNKPEMTRRVVLGSQVRPDPTMNHRLASMWDGKPCYQSHYA